MQVNDIPTFDFDTWNQINITFSADSIHMSVNGLVCSAKVPCNNSSPQNIFFGGNEDAKFSTTEVPPLTIKNIRFFDKKQKEIAYWPLDKHINNTTYDTYNKVKAFALHPKWEIDSHYNWDKKETFVFPPFPQIAFDSVTEKLYIAQQNRIAIYDVQQNKLEYMNDVKGLPYQYMANQMVYDCNRGHLISYVIKNNQLLFLDFEKKDWRQTNNIRWSPNFWHHSKVFIPEDSVLITVGGYGYHRYQGVMMKHYLGTEKWEEVDISQTLTPRYLGSMGYLGNGELLYFGGYGSESGNQEEAPHNYYDLYKINVRTNAIEKLWEKELKPGEEHYTNSNSMVIDSEKGVFYTLTYTNKLYNANIQVREFNINSSECKLVGDTIPYTFTDNRSYCDLFLCSKSGKLLAVTSHTKEREGISDINIYTIAYRPYALEDILAESEVSHGYGLQIVGAIILLVLLGGGIYALWRKKNSSNATKPEQLTDLKGNKITPFLSNLEWNEDIPVEIIPSSIILLGGFQVIDKDGKDITRKFSPTVKSLFLLILLATFKTGKGITSASLRDILWEDKDDSSARNNRNVNLSKLRPLLQTIGEIEVTDDDNYWAVSIGKGVYCDYQTVWGITSKISTSPQFNKALLIELLRIISRGLLLPNTHAEWLDNYKSEYSNLLIDFLLEVSRRTEVANDYELLSRIGDIILLHDNIDEDGITLKCYGLYQLGKKGKALQCYNKFSEEYKNLLNEPYKKDFNSLVKGEFIG